MLYNLSMKYNKRNTNTQIEAPNEKIATELIHRFTLSKVIAISPILKLDTQSDGVKAGGRNVKVIARSSLAKAQRQFLFHDVKVSDKELARNVKRYLTISGKKIDSIIRPRI